MSTQAVSEATRLAATSHLTLRIAIPPAGRARFACPPTLHTSCIVATPGHDGELLKAKKNRLPFEGESRSRASIAIDEGRLRVRSVVVAARMVVPTRIVAVRRIVGAAAIVVAVVVVAVVVVTAVVRRARIVAVRVRGTGSGRRGDQAGRDQPFDATHVSLRRRGLPVQRRRAALVAAITQKVSICPRLDWTQRRSRPGVWRGWLSARNAPPTTLPAPDLASAWR